jgi:hypothetical protein
MVQVELGGKLIRLTHEVISLHSLLFQFSGAWRFQVNLYLPIFPQLVEKFRLAV